MTPAVSAQSKGSPLIVPGKSVGEISLGMKESELHKKLGPPLVGEGAAGSSYSGWFAPKEGGGRGAELDTKSSLVTGDDGVRSVREIRLESAFFHTKEGISTQSSLAEIWKAFPELRYRFTDNEDAAVECYVDTAHGIAIEVRRTKAGSDSLTVPGGAWGVCQAIIILEPGDPSPNLHSMRNMPAD